MDDGVGGVFTSFFALGLGVGSNKVECGPMVASMPMCGYSMVSVAYTILHIMLQYFLFSIDDLNEARRYLKETAEDIKDIDDKDRRLLLRDIKNW